jgi:hypothetical protein
MDWLYECPDESAEAILLAISEMAVIRALELAGSRLTKKHDRSYRSALNELRR